MNVHSAILRICRGIFASVIGMRTVSESHIRSSFHNFRLAKPNTVYAYSPLFAIPAGPQIGFLCERFPETAQKAA